jgi:hypothetical protein
MRQRTILANLTMVRSTRIFIGAPMMRFVVLLLPVLVLGAAFQYVSRQVTSGAPSNPFPSAPVALAPINPDILKGGLTADSRALAQMNGQNIANQNRHFQQHMEDIRNYAGNPAGWHGPSPFLTGH